MKKKLFPALPFLIMPILIPFYWLLDKLILVDVFGCGCVPSVQENMLGIAFNSNDVRLTVFATLAIGLSIWSIFLAKILKRKIAKILYCLSVIVMNGLLALWVIKTFMWL
jgi:hypothetical protein